MQGIQILHSSPRSHFSNLKGIDSYISCKCSVCRPIPPTLVWACWFMRFTRFHLVAQQNKRLMPWLKLVKLYTFLSSSSRLETQKKKKSFSNCFLKQNLSGQLSVFTLRHLKSITWGTVRSTKAHTCDQSYNFKIYTEKREKTRRNIGSTSRQRDLKSGDVHRLTWQRKYW